MHEEQGELWMMQPMRTTFTFIPIEIISKCERKIISRHSDTHQLKAHTRGSTLGPRPSPRPSGWPLAAGWLRRWLHSVRKESCSRRSPPGQRLGEDHRGTARIVAGNRCAQGPRGGAACRRWSQGLASAFCPGSDRMPKRVHERPTSRSSRSQSVL